MMHPLDKLELEVIKIENEIILLKERIKIDLVRYTDANKSQKPVILSSVDYNYNRLTELYRNLYDTCAEILERQSEIEDDEYPEDEDNIGL